MAARIKLGMSVVGIGSANELAKRVQVSRQTAARWLHRHTEVGDLETLIRLSEVLHLCPIWLVTGQGTPTPMIRPSPDEAKLIEAFRMLPAVRQRELVEAVCGCVAARPTRGRGRGRASALEEEDED
jgi:transcriptional regulator with XRE-family HTH domain